MIITMDSAGRLVIPSAIRKEAALEPGMPLEVRSRDGVIEIEPKPLEVRLERRGRLLVAAPTSKIAVLRAAAVERTRRAVRSRSGQR